MKLDDCVYVLADWLDETVNVDKSLHGLGAALSATEFTVEQVVEQFTKDYKCSPEVYIENIQADLLLDEDFDSL